ncbi:26S proteasome non-ATPase regulatory subunit 10 [Pelomyxa schiedti]|nr:26S proteasome non-ATPase regulatory subunit 10 [Pelomyxa schiedti]
MGAILDERDIRGRTALHAACGSGHSSIVHFLLSHHADPNLCDKQGNSPLLVASGSYADIIKELLLAGADVNAPNQWGKRPLHKAAEEGNLQCAKILLESGALSHRTDSFGRIPLHYACIKGDPSIVELLLAHGSDPNCCDSRGKKPVELTSSVPVCTSQSSMPIN